ncbi:hypothetical protein Hdeb2414_s0001g00002641 [Helianthus debilis subsp. tardiflorus]
MQFDQIEGLNQFQNEIQAKISDRLRERIISLTLDELGEAWRR